VLTAMDIRIDEDISSFLEDNVGNYRAVELLDGDASTRIYWRVRAAGGTFVLCRDAGFINAVEAGYPFTVVHRILKDSVPVPEIIAMDSRRGLFLLQDLGDDLLEYIYPLLDSDRIARLYQTCVENIFSIQMIRGKGEAPFSLCFDPDKLMYEFEFFIEHALQGYFKADVPGDDMSLVKSEFLKISKILYRPDLFVLAHRDYHSRNLIVFNDIPYIIDFQDARMGLPHYDVVSLLRDSYVVLDAGVFEYLKNYYYEGGKDMGILSMGRDEFNYYFDIMAFQRNVKALGTFGFQTAVKGNKKYERYIRPTAAYLGDYAERQNELEKAWRVLSNYISGN
jgi:aminoglycoside/choline kinase family phosphotransferase